MEMGKIEIITEDDRVGKLLDILAQMKREKDEAQVGWTACVTENFNIAEKNRELEIDLAREVAEKKRYQRQAKVWHKEVKRLEAHLKEIQNEFNGTPISEETQPPA
jgi:hypothetical protein